MTEPLVKRVQENSAEYLDQSSLEELENIHRLTGEDRNEANEAFINARTSMIQEATEGLFANPLTDEQAGAIATDEDCTLVLAGAGTGKTAVIIGKIAHLVRNEGVAPGSILALAFNRDAAMEIRNRLPEDLKGVQASTFHSFALGIVAERTGRKPSISPMATDEFLFRKAIDGFLNRMMKDPDMALRIVELLCNQQVEYEAPFEFKNEAEYREFTRGAELRALNGRMVKSFEELTIANFLTANGVPFEYEAEYEIDTASGKFRQYHPDFHIRGTNIYIEHFAMNREGNPPDGWQGYAEGAEWKRKTHLENGTALVETYSWQHQAGILLDELEGDLRERGVEFAPIEISELIKKLSQERVSWLSSLLGTFLNHVKSEGLDGGDLEERTSRTGDRNRARNFLQVFTEVQGHYQRTLEEENTLDFHDLVNQATQHMKSGKGPAPFTHILIDEFQDISRGRIEMAKALRTPGTRYFVVGDDWQSIYRFAGSDVGLILNCDRELGYTQRRELTLTFRYGRGIAGPSNAFIQANPEQSRRDLGTLERGDDQGMTVVAGQEPAEGVRAAIHDILTKKGYSLGEEIILLARYRSTQQILNQVRGARDWNQLGGRKIPVRLTFKTAHSAKGQEADHVIILDLRNHKYGFPCRVDDDPIMDMVLPPRSADGVPFAEERRLFYVAMTRARKGAYLIADGENPSPFVWELLKQQENIRTIGNLPEICPWCNQAVLTRSQTGQNLRCLRHPYCRYLAPRCTECKLGYIRIERNVEWAHCNNPECRKKFQVCHECRTGVMLVRVPRNGGRPFLGCSQYGAELKCGHTEQIPEAKGQDPTNPGTEPSR